MTRQDDRSVLWRSLPSLVELSFDAILAEEVDVGARIKILNKANKRCNKACRTFFTLLKKISHIRHKPRFSGCVLCYVVHVSLCSTTSRDFFIMFLNRGNLSCSIPDKRTTTYFLIFSVKQTSCKHRLLIYCADLKVVSNTREESQLFPICRTIAITKSSILHHNVHDFCCSHLSDGPEQKTVKWLPFCSTKSFSFSAA